jgi:hypothetical protein
MPKMLCLLNESIKLVGSMSPKRSSTGPRPASSQDELPKLCDPNHVAEIYANHTAGISVRDGVIHITLSIIRPLHSGRVTGPDLENIVAARIALPIPAMEALLVAYTQLRTALTSPPAKQSN